jgi:hypothetical protein
MMPVLYAIAFVVLFGWVLPWLICRRIFRVWNDS